MQCRLLITCCALLLFLAQCSNKGEAIIEPRAGTLRFTTYTVDSFRFRVMLNEELLTDSLLSPVSSVMKPVKFFDSLATLKIYDAKRNQVIVDSTIKLKIGQSTISLVQFITGERPFIPSSPNEPLPSPGNVKVRFQYVQPSNQLVPFFDSIRCVIRISSITTPIDTVILKKYQTSRYYQAAPGTTFRMILYNPATDAVIDNTTNNLSLTGFTAFNTASLAGTGISGSQYNFSLQRIY